MKHYCVRVEHGTMTTEQLMEKAIETVEQMSGDEKANVKARLREQFGFGLKSFRVRIEHGTMIEHVRAKISVN